MTNDFCWQILHNSANVDFKSRQNIGESFEMRRVFFTVVRDQLATVCEIPSFPLLIAYSLIIIVRQISKSEEAQLPGNTSSKSFLTARSIGKLQPMNSRVFVYYGNMIFKLQLETEK